MAPTDLCDTAARLGCATWNQDEFNVNRATWSAVNILVHVGAIAFVFLFNHKITGTAKARIWRHIRPRGLEDAKQYDDLCWWVLCSVAGVGLGCGAGAFLVRSTPFALSVLQAGFVCWPMIQVVQCIMSLATKFTKRELGVVLAEKWRRIPLLPGIFLALDTLLSNAPFGLKSCYLAATNFVKEERDKLGRYLDRAKVELENTTEAESKVYGVGQAGLTFAVVLFNNRAGTIWDAVASLGNWENIKAAVTSYPLGLIPILLAGCFWHYDGLKAPVLPRYILAQFQSLLGLLILRLFNSYFNLNLGVADALSYSGMQSVVLCSAHDRLEGRLSCPNPHPTGEVEFRYLSDYCSRSSEAEFAFHDQSNHVVATVLLAFCLSFVPFSYRIWKQHLTGDMAFGHKRRKKRFYIRNILTIIGWSSVGLMIAAALCVHGPHGFLSFQPLAKLCLLVTPTIVLQIIASEPVWFFHDKWHSVTKKTNTTAPTGCWARISAWLDRPCRRLQPVATYQPTGPTAVKLVKKADDAKATAEKLELEQKTEMTKLLETHERERETERKKSITKENDEKEERQAAQETANKKAKAAEEEKRRKEALAILESLGDSQTESVPSGGVLRFLSLLFCCCARKQSVVPKLSKPAVPPRPPKQVALIDQSTKSGSSWRFWNKAKVPIKKPDSRWFWKTSNQAKDSKNGEPQAKVKKVKTANQRGKTVLEKLTTLFRGTSRIDEKQEERRQCQVHKLKVKHHGKLSKARSKARETQARADEAKLAELNKQTTMTGRRWLQGLVAVVLAMLPIAQMSFWGGVSWYLSFFSGDFIHSVVGDYPRSVFPWIIFYVAWTLTDRKSVTPLAWATMIPALIAYLIFTSSPESYLFKVTPVSTPSFLQASWQYTCKPSMLPKAYNDYYDCFSKYV